MGPSSDLFPLVLLGKLVFLFCVVMQCVLWPCAATILVCALHGLWALYHYSVQDRATLLSELRVPGVFLVAPNRGAKAYTHMVVMAIYFCVFFLLFSDETLRHVGSMVPWLPPARFGNYSFAPNALKDVDVTSSLSTQMREESFFWQRKYTVPAPPVKGSLPWVKGNSATDITCGAANAAFQCYAKFLDASDQMPRASGGWTGIHPFVPLPSQLYSVDLLVEPPKDVPCEHLEVYRVVLDSKRVPMVPLDYPSSTAVLAASSNTFAKRCGLFGDNDWCLGQQHTFTNQEYQAAQAEQCKQYGGKLVMRLPPRGVEVDAATGYMSADVLLVTAGATVTLHAEWVAPDDFGHWYLSPFKLLVKDDGVTRLRESSDSVDLFGKFFIAITPLLILWYYLTIYYSTDGSRQLSLLGIFVLLPSACFFLSVGAYVPLAGILLTIVAIHYPTANDETSLPLKTHMRPLLLFVTAATNSVEFAWIVALAVQAGWSAFYYEYTLSQLYSMSYQFVVTDASSPTWVALFMPGLLLTTFVYLLGASLCVVLEMVSGKSR